MGKSYYSRQINFETIDNFRDLGGYQTLDGRTIAWRRIFRSGNFCNMTGNDMDKLKSQIGLNSVMDLRSNIEIEKQGTGLISQYKLKYFNISLIPDGGDRQANEKRYQGMKNMGEFYISLSRQKGFGELIIEALEIISEPANHPLAFHCSAGKDRTGILAAFLMSALKVSDEYITRDFSLSAAYMELLLNKMKTNGKMSENDIGLPDFFWQASPELMELFLSALKGEYGSIRRYLEIHGAEVSLFTRLEHALLN